MARNPESARSWSELTDYGDDPFDAGTDGTYLEAVDGIWRLVHNHSDGVQPAHSAIYAGCLLRNMEEIWTIAWNAAWADALIQEDAPARTTVAASAFWAVMFSAIRDSTWNHAPIRAAMEVWVPYLDLLESGAGFIIVGSRAVILVPEPEMRVDPDGYLHCEDGPAVSWRHSRERYWFLDGINVAQSVVERSSEITIEMIDKESRIEIKRLLIDRYQGGIARGGGPAAFFDACRAQIIDHAEDIGAIWRRCMNSKPVHMIELLRSMPDRPKSLRRYWLRLPPQVTNLQEAVKWASHPQRNTDFQI